jgi:serine/threonine-protein kinase HipA
MSLPLSRRHHPQARVTAFFQGLLPEGQQLTAMAQYVDVAESNTFALLAEFGKDVAGALYLTTDNEPEAVPPHQYRPLSLEELAREVETSRLDQGMDAFEPLGNTPTLRGRSLGGYQGKRLVAQFDGSWFDPVGGSPSTHIAKPQSVNVNHPDLTENEAVTMQFAQRLGITTTESELHHVEGTVFMTQSRFDRVIDGPHRVRRIHQEDGCQATGTVPGRKYEASGGPSLQSIARLLAPAERETFLGQLTFKAVIGDTDAHAKNTSFVHREDGRVTLAPLYDCQPGLHYVANSLAQRINGVSTFPVLSAADLVAEGAQWGIDIEAASRIVRQTVVGMAVEFPALDVRQGNLAAFEVVERRIAQFVANV